MADDTRKLSITYSSGLIPPPEIMSTLAIFYDEIWLPYPYELDPQADRSKVLFYMGNQKHYILPVISRKSFIPDPSEIRNVQDKFICQRDPWRSLFEAGILKNTPPIQEIILDPSSEAFQKMIPPKLPGNIHNINPLTTYILAIHIFLVTKIHPELFISDPSDTSTSRLGGFLVQSLFHYQVPQLQTLNAEQILEVRDYLKDTKEGFTYYIHEMTDDVEQRLKGGNLSEIAAAQKTFERKILPQYEEFRRQLAARKTGYWANVLSASADFLKVDATPWTPKFYGEILKLLGVVLNLTAKDEEALLTNKSQAFQYLARLESKVARTTS